MLIYLSMIESEADKSLFEQLYIRYKGLMYHIAYRILQNREDAEDAVHQAFVSIAKNIKKITEVDCPKTYGYIVTIIERKSIDSLRANKHIVSTDFEESDAIYFTYEQATDGAQTKLFTDDAGTEPVIVNGAEGEFYLSQDSAESNSMVWFDGKNNILFSISGFIDKDTMIEMAESVKNMSLSN